MPKYYCDYCDTFLTHDSVCFYLFHFDIELELLSQPSVRKTHNGGRKHKENVRLYYQTWMEQQAQKLVDATSKTVFGELLIDYLIFICVFKLEHLKKAK